MKDYLVELVRQMPMPTQGRNLAREYLQARILADVRPFAEPGFDLGLLTLANLERVLRDR